MRIESKKIRTGNIGQPGWTDSNGTLIERSYADSASICRERCRQIDVGATMTREELLERLQSIPPP